MWPARLRASGLSSASTCPTGSSTSWWPDETDPPYLLGAALPLAGCGFQPVYMPSAEGETGVAERELATIYVNLIPDRPGQLLRQALQQRLEGAGGSSSPIYTLTVNYWITGEGLGIQPDKRPPASACSATPTGCWSAATPHRHT